MAEPAIRVAGLTKVFGPDPLSVMPMVRDGRPKDRILAETGHMVALRDIELEIEPGEIFVVMGLSGSGKSTLVRHLNRLVEPTEGAITVAGVDVMALDAAALEAFRRDHVSMVFQRFALMPHMTVLENAAFGLQVRELAKEDREARARDWLATVGLAGYAERMPAELSGGQQQRVGLARALATDPEILLMDEPFSALDPLIRSEMQAQLLELQGKLKKTVVFISHDLDEALRLGDRIAILDDGRLVQIGRARDIILRPANDFVAAFVRDVNRARALTVGAVMTAVADRTPPAGGPTLKPEATLQDALAAVVAADRPVPVVSANGAILGTLSRDDVVAALAGAGPAAGSE